MVMHVQQEQLPGTRHTFTENAATKVFAIVKLVFANASRVTQDLAVVAVSDFLYLHERNRI